MGLKRFLNRQITFTSFATVTYSKTSWKKEKERTGKERKEKERKEKVSLKSSNSFSFFWYSHGDEIRQRKRIWPSMVLG